ncbi:MAG: GTPase required for pre-60S ribosomal subunit nuclear export and maturation [Vezdaea aestivalis]|nr:MAG: GTPase required for pre-60S ribosomal subunit nuclear export and maturation [Vezdaea aestivalis]
MGVRKKEATRKERQGKVGDEYTLSQRHTKNKLHSDAKKAKLLRTFEGGRPQRNASGRITKAGAFQSREKPQGRIEPHRKWFGNTRVISQDNLDAFRKAVAEQTSNPYQVLLKTNKLPMTLIREPKGKNGLKEHQAKVAVESAPFGDTFGPKAQRKRVKLGVQSLEDFAGESSRNHESYVERLEEIRLLSGNPGEEEVAGEDTIREMTTLSTAREAIFSKGQSKRIWNELYKVMDSSDVVIHVLDARDPLGTRCRSVEKYLKEEAPHKHLIFILNKCDLVPTGVAASWVRLLSKEVPTLAFHASITNSFGKGSLIQTLRQYALLHSNRKQISVGFIGYPNTGKSSIINTLRGKKVCTVAPIPGETKIWQYIRLWRSIYLIDCPGVVPPKTSDSDQDILLRGVVRVENVENPEQYIAALLDKTQTRHIERTYQVRGWSTHIEFLEMMARRSGRLLKAGEPDVDGVAKMVINDFLRGKIPWFTPPPAAEGEGLDGDEETGLAEEPAGGDGQGNGVETSDGPLVDEAVAVAEQLAREANQGKLQSEGGEEEEVSDEDVEEGGASPNSSFGGFSPPSTAVDEGPSKTGS